MPLINSDEISKGSELKSKFCLIGSGIIGSIMAQELSEKFNDIIILESGNLEFDSSCQELYDIKNVGYPQRDNFLNRLRYFGGTSNIWGGRMMPLTKIDFKKRDWVSNSGWPIDYDEVFSYYGRAQKRLNLPESFNLNPESWKRYCTEEELSFFNSKTLLPMISMWGKKPISFGKDSKFYNDILKDNRVSVLLNANASKINLDDSHNIVKNILVKTIKGNNFSVHAEQFIICAGGIENARLLLSSNHQIKKGLGNDNGLVGRYFMDHPRSLHGRIELKNAFGSKLMPGMLFKDFKVQMGVALNEDTQKKYGLLNNHIHLEVEKSNLEREFYDYFAQIYKKYFLIKKRNKSKIHKSDFSVPDLIYQYTPLESLPHSIYRLYSFFDKKLSLPRIRKNHVILNFCEQEPNYSSRVYLINEKDQLGMKKIALDWKISNSTIETLNFLQNKLKEHFKNNDFGKFYDYVPNWDETSVSKVPKIKDKLAFTDASHHIGTTRMSINKKEGVVDKNCKVYGLNNLYVSGSSVFPTSGYANPTLTSVSLCIRLSDFFKSKF